MSVPSWPRRAMAFLGSTEPRTALPRQAIIADACLALAAVLAALAALGFVSLAAKVAAVLATAPLAARRLAPLGVFWAILIGVVMLGSGNTMISYVAILVAGYSAVVYTATSSWPRPVCEAGKAARCCRASAEGLHRFKTSP